MPFTYIRVGTKSQQFLKRLQRPAHLWGTTTLHRLSLKKQLQRLPRNENVKVFVVDGSTSPRKYIFNLLKPYKYQTLGNKGKREALDVLESDSDNSVIITNNEMPNMNGDELCAAIYQINELLKTSWFKALWRKRNRPQ